MRKPAVAVIGAGYWGKNIIRALHKLDALSCICDSSDKALELQREAYAGVRTETDYQAVLDDATITAVAIASPAARHADMIRQALEAGKDVYVEKPLCLSESEGASLVALAASLGRVLMVGHLLHYHDAVVKLKEMISQGEMGKIHYIYSNRLNLGKFRSEENALWSFAPHDVSVILGLAGEMPETVFCNGGAFLQEGVHDSTCALLSFPSGMRAHIFTSWLNPFKEQKLVVVGSRKMAVFDDVQAPERKLLIYPHVINWKGNFPVPEKKEPEAVGLQGSEPLLNEMSHFLDVRDGTESTRDRRRGGFKGPEGAPGVPEVARYRDEGIDARKKGNLLRPSDRSRRPARGYRRGDVHLALHARDEGLQDRPLMQHRPERGHIAGREGRG